jgi:hypothetical protein
MVGLVKGRQFGSKLLIAFAVTCISTDVSLLGVTGSLQGSASSISGIERAQLGTPKMLLGTANTCLHLCSFQFGSQKPEKG